MSTSPEFESDHISYNVSRYRIHIQLCLNSKMFFQSKINQKYANV